MATAFLLTRPWGLHSSASGATGEPAARHVLEPGGRLTDLPPGCGFWVAAPETARIAFGGRRTLAGQTEGGSFGRAGARFRLRALPIGADIREAEFRVRLPEGEVKVCLRDPPVRPKTPEVEGAFGVLLRMLLVLVGRLRALSESSEAHEPVELEAVGRKLLGALVPWPTAVRRWCDSHETGEPPLDLIVRQAEELLALTEELAAHPRKVLARVRTLQPVARLQEMDAACIDWYVRQPGRTIRERAGARQRLLGVARVESRDTLENRVLRAYLDLAQGEAERYRALHRALTASQRQRLVSRFARSCRHLGRELAADGVGLPVLPVTPNFVLQSDRRYRRIWEAWRALLRREQEEDDVWRWQPRLWAEFCRLTLLVALRRCAGSRVVAEAPLRVKADQEHGRWVDVSPHPAVFHIETGGLDAAVTVIDAQSPEAGSFRGGLNESQGEALWEMVWSLGAAAVLHAQDLDPRDPGQPGEGWVLVWTVHPLVPGRMDLAREVAQAGAALVAAARQLDDLHGFRVPLAGIVLLSAPPDDGEAPECAHGDVFGYRCGVDGARLGKVVDGLTKLLPVACGAVR